ncbi:hypothetical protein AGOR_G00173400 [Albula goreensis]|uniref:Uncharacterized protein n=1 Tax=Albula goreensis TaxID=1534307 RepID=A0A8T3D2N6_9TELE|nr:hypothetical protein AGOR_G00173400 [Albula goreensis]
MEDVRTAQMNKLIESISLIRLFTWFDSHCLSIHGILTWKYSTKRRQLSGSSTNSYEWNSLEEASGMSQSNFPCLPCPHRIWTLWVWQSRKWRAMLITRSMLSDKKQLKSGFLSLPLPGLTVAIMHAVCQRHGEQCGAAAANWRGDGSAPVNLSEVEPLQPSPLCTTCALHRGLCPCLRRTRGVKHEKGPVCTAPPAHAKAFHSKWLCSSPQVSLLCAPPPFTFFWSSSS